MSNKSESSKSATKVVEKSEYSQLKPHLFLDQLEVDVTSTIVVMIGRVWDGNMIHYTAKSNVAHNLLRMKEGGIYAVKKFVIEPANNKYLIDVSGKGVTRQQRKWLCEACNKTVDYPIFRYMLEVVVADDTTHIVLMMFNDTSTELIKCSAESLMGADDEGTDADDDSNLPTAIRN
ncbi:nucleic acid-binding, OB-fold protein, partial [Tanacetum coccineum]